MIEKKLKVQKMFDSISGKYDFLNHTLSAGIDIYWRNKAISLTEIKNNSKILDLACGTGDFALAIMNKFPVDIYGADLSINMLKLFYKKNKYFQGKNVQTIAEIMPFKNHVFNNITVAFGVRNFYDLEKAFEEFYRILINEGKVTILEFRLPKNKFIKNLYLFYFNKILPLIGKIISKDKEAYTYLPESVGEFDKNVNLTELLKKAGFKNIKLHSLTFGVVQVVIGQKFME